MDITFIEVIERMKSAANLKNSSQIAKSLSITPQAIANYKKRNQVPTSLVIKFASIYNLSVDWILWGTGHMQSPDYQTQEFTASVAAESVLPYDYKLDKSLPALETISDLSPDELICLGKLLKILRSTNENEQTTIKFILDNFNKDN